MAIRASKGAVDGAVEDVLCCCEGGGGVEVGIVRSVSDLERRSVAEWGAAGGCSEDWIWDAAWSLCREDRAGGRGIRSGIRRGWGGGKRVFIPQRGIHGKAGGGVWVYF